MNALPSRRACATVSAALLALLAGALPAAAQDDRAVLQATVTSASTGEPLRGAQVSVYGVRRRGTTDERGFLRLDGIPHGQREVEIRLLGHQTQRLTLALERGATRELTVALVVAPIAVAGVATDAHRSSWGGRMLDAQGFYERQRTGMGTFLTREQIESQNPSSLGAFVRRHTRVQVSTNTYSATTGGRRVRRGPNSCPPSYVVDGFTLPGFHIDDIRPEQVEAVEIYSGASAVPPAFNRGSALCGVVVIWTRVS